MKSKLETNNISLRNLCVFASLCLVFLASATITAPGTAAQAAENRAGLVVQFPDDSTQTFCLTFSGDTISGLDLLSESGLPLKVEAFGGLGAQICQIGPTGCDYPNQACACQSYGTNGVYWSYHHLQDGKWKASIVGAGSYRVHPGDVEGWAWSEGGPPSAVYTFDQLCPAVEPTVAPTLVPTDTPAPTNTTVAIRPTATAPPPPPSPTPIPEVSPTEGQPAATPSPTTTMPARNAHPHHYPYLYARIYTYAQPHQCPCNEHFDSNCDSHVHDNSHTGVK